MSVHRQAMSNRNGFIFLLLKNFSMISYASAIEPLRLANRTASTTLYEWSTLSEGGRPVCCSNGTEVVVDGDLAAVGHNDVIVICGGVDIAAATTPAIINWLRREASKGVKVAGTCTAAHTMAVAGLLNGRTATIHWENRDSFQEHFPHIQLSRSLFVMDGNRITTAGGISSIDFMLTLIAADQGREFTSEVADQLLYDAIRTDRHEQRLSTPTRIGVRHSKLADVIQLMEENIEEPIRPSSLARESGMSTRQLERLFRRYLNRSPKRYYLELRLQRARNLLLQTDMSVLDISMACGFGSPSHFSRCYRSYFSTTPHRERGAHPGS